MKIYLIGMPGSGKTTLGKQLAENIHLEFIDLDLEIEKRSGKSVSEIFRDSGEDQFRLIESKLLNECAASSRDFIMATGGGAPCFYQGIDVINSTGISIFIDVSVELLVSRLKADENRPLLPGDEQEKRKKLFDLRNTRLGIYQQATIALINPTIKDLVDVLRTRI
jgi:shikimate kinase